jgi:MFS family permease
MKTDRRMLNFYGEFFLFYFGIACAYSLLIPFLISLGYRAGQRSLFFVADALCGMAMQVWMGYLCDRSRRIKPYLFACIGGFVAVSAVMYATTRQVYWLHFFLTAGVGGMYRVTLGLLDSFVLESGPLYKEQYGMIRAFGSIGWAAGCPVAAWCAEHFGYASLGVLTAAAMALSVLLAARQPEVAKQSRGPKITPADVRDLLKDPIYRYATVMLLLFFIVDMVHTYAMPDKFAALNATDQQLSWFWSLTAMLELPLFFLGGRLERKIGSRPMMILLGVSCVLKYACYGLAATVDQVYLAALLHTFTYPILIVCSKTLIDEATPPQLKTSGQQVAMAVYSGGSAILTPLATGLLTDAFGIRSCLLIMAGFALIPLGLTFGHKAKAVK